MAKKTLVSLKGCGACDEELAKAKPHLDKGEVDVVHLDPEKDPDERQMRFLEAIEECDEKADRCSVGFPSCVEVDGDKMTTCDLDTMPWRAKGAKGFVQA